MTSARRFFETHPADFDRLGTGELRARFLVDLSDGGNPSWASIGYERFVVGMARLGPEPLPIEPPAAFGSEYLCQRRELAIVCLSGSATATVDGTGHALEPLDVLYVGLGSREVTLAGPDAHCFLVSAPAHRTVPVQRLTASEAETVALGAPLTSNERVIRKYLHDGGGEACQLTLGITSLAAGSVWNTMPSHTHERRTELYLYFGLGEGRVLHLCGPADATRSIVVADEQLVIAPPWSVHTGAGTQAYSFVWVMAGENRDYSDIAPVDALR